MEDCKAVYGDGPLWVTDVKAKLPIFIPPGSKGVAALTPMTLPALFHEAVQKNPEGNAIGWRVVDTVATEKGSEPSFYKFLATKADGSHWEFLTWKELEVETYAFAAACLACGLEAKQAVVVMGFNTPQWMLATHGVPQAGGVIAGSYPTNNKETCIYLAKDCGAKLCLVENWSHGSKFADVLTDSSAPLSKIIVWGNMDACPKDLIESGQVISFADFMATGKALAGGVEKVKAIEAALEPTECVQLIYTSGTTGMPKGVMLSHDNLTWDVKAAFQIIKEETGVVMGTEQVYLSYLPLSHIAAQVLDIMMATCSAGTLYFATPDALAGGLLPLLQQTRPTFFFAVPRVWEKMMDSMKAKAAARNLKGIKAKVPVWAKAFALRRNMNLAESGGTRTGDWGGCSLQAKLYNKKVYSAVRQLVGLDRAFLLGSGAAPISKEVLSYFWSLDMPIIEGFGMSETTGVMTMSLFPKNIRLGCVGSEMCDGAVKLDFSKGSKEGQGEICLRGRNIMMGYLGKPDKTAETFDEERYLRSGDLGTLTPSPNKKSSKTLLAITGRIKELIITAGGENVPPVLIEDAIKANCPMVANAMLIGDKRKYLTILLTLRSVVDPVSLEPSDELDANFALAAKPLGITCTTVTEAKKDPAVLDAIQKGIDKYNKEGAASRAQNIQKFVILDKDFSVPGGELTGTQKLKKNVVLEKYASQIESMYGV